MKALVYMDGQLLPPEQAKVSVMDRGFLFGDGVYEAGRSYEGVFLFLEEHWDRFRKSSAKIRLDIPWSDAELTEGLHAALTGFKKSDVCFRTIVTRGAIDVVGLDVETLGKPTLVHIVQDIPPKFDEQRKIGAVLITSRVLRNPAEAQDPNIKTSNYLNSLLAQQEVKSRGPGDAVMCDSKGHLTEGTNFSVFGVTEENEVMTPSLGVGILDSITRRHVIAHARKEGKVREGQIKLESFLKCREVFIVSSTREIMPVRKWDDRSYCLPGEVTERLHKRLKEEIGGYVKTHQ